MFCRRRRFQKCLCFRNVLNIDKEVQNPVLYKKKTTTAMIIQFKSLLIEHF